MTLGQSIASCLKNYFTFSGRASRSEYWWFFLAVMIINLILNITWQAGFADENSTQDSSNPLNSLFALLVFIPLLAAGWRRMHDTGKPGWLLLLPALISLVAMIVLFGGIAGFSMLEQNTADPDALRRPAALLGSAGIFSLALVQFILSILLLWWLSRPSQPGANQYGEALE